MAASIDGREIRQAAEFRVALRTFMAHSDRIVRRAGLTPQRYLLLLMVSAAGDRPATIGGIAEGLHLAQSTVSELVDRCEQAGLVRRGGGEDGRVVEVEATELGERLLAGAVVGLREERRRLVEHVGPALGDVLRRGPAGDGLASGLMGRDRS